MWFEQLSGMRINFHKSELIPMDVDNETIHRLAHLFTCSIGTTIKYLGIPLHYDKLSREGIQPLVDKMLKLMAGWRAICCPIRLN